MSIDIKKLLTNAVVNGKLSLDELKDLVVEMLDDLKRYDSKMYDDISLELYKHIYGDEITLECAKEIVSKMKPNGEKWSYETLNQYNKGYDKVNFYLVMNMFWNDYKTVIGNDLNTYVKLTEAWFEDIDAKPEKTFDYFMK